MPDLSTQVREYYDRAAEPVSAAEILALHPIGEPSGSRRGPLPGWAVALLVAVAVFVVVGGMAVILGGSEGSVAPAGEDRWTPTTLGPSNSTPDDATDDAAEIVPLGTQGVEPEVDSGPVDQEVVGSGDGGSMDARLRIVESIPFDGFVSDVVVSPSGEVWATALDADLTSDIYYGLWDLEYVDWALLSWAGGTWEVMSSSADDRLPEPFTDRGLWTQGLQLLGVRHDGGVWVHDHTPAPSGPFVLLEFIDGDWVDHSDDAFLPGRGDAPVSMDCCRVGIDDEGTVWVASEDWPDDVTWEDFEDGADLGDEWWPQSTVARYNGVWELMYHEGDPGIPLATYPSGLGSKKAFIDGVVNANHRWSLSHDWERTGRWRYSDGQDARTFDVEYDRLEEALTCSPAQGVFDLDTESVVAADGALWTLWPCIGVSRIDPADGSMALLTEGFFSLNIWRMDMATDGTVWVSGSGGVAAVAWDSES